MNFREIVLPGDLASVRFHAWSDNAHPHYILAGEKFNDDKLVLELLLQSNGVCMLGPNAHASRDIQCNFDCNVCKNSIYHVVKQKRAQYMVQCEEACSRHPKAGDEWEISFVMRKPRVPTYENFYFEATAYVPSKTIVEIIYEALTNIDPTFFDDAQYQYVKVMRFDMTRPLDVSSVANDMLRAMNEKN